MHKFFMANHEPIKLIAEHALIPIHLLISIHVYSVATLVAGLVVAAYVAAAVCQARARATA